MITKQDLLSYLNNDNWFVPSNSPYKTIIKDSSGKDMEVPKSYYHQFKNGCYIKIRVSDHGTSLNTWVRRRYKPNDSLQNLSLVFCGQPISSKLEIVDANGKDEKGASDSKPLYFVVEQYHYNINYMQLKDFIKIIKVVKQLGNDRVFVDPFRDKPSKKANRTVLTPNDRNGKKIPSGNNIVHPRQTTVADNPYKEVDANRNVLEKNLRVTANDLAKIIRECVHEELSKLLY